MCYDECNGNSVISVRGGDIITKLWTKKRSMRKFLEVRIHLKEGVFKVAIFPSYSTVGMIDISRMKSKEIDYYLGF